MQSNCLKPTQKQCILHLEVVDVPNNYLREGSGFQDSNSVIIKPKLWFTFKAKFLTLNITLLDFIYLIIRVFAGRLLTSEICRSIKVNQHLVMFNNAKNLKIQLNHNPNTNISII